MSSVQSWRARRHFFKKGFPSSRSSLPGKNYKSSCHQLPYFKALPCLNFEFQICVCTEFCTENGYLMMDRNEFLEKKLLCLACMEASYARIFNKRRRQWNTKDASSHILENDWFDNRQFDRASESRSKTQKCMELEPWQILHLMNTQKHECFSAWFCWMDDSNHCSFSMHT